MMAMQSARKLVGGVLGLVAGATRHAVWYLRYQLDGRTQEPSQADERDAA
jgi:hypothetical protein